MFSKACEYAIKIMISLAVEQQHGKWVGIDVIAETIASPRAFTAKILQQLVRADLLESVRGPSGGFCIPDNKIIFLADIVIAIDGDKLITNCVLGFKQCSEAHPCPVHHKFKPVRGCLSDFLITTSLGEIKEVLNDSLAYIRD